MLNVKRGYRRLAVAVVGSWLAVWGAVGAFGAYSQSEWSRIYVDATASGNSGMAISANAQGREAAQLIEAALLWGALAVPMSALFAVGWWVYRGFRS